jgi:hypothetical protein
MTLAEFQQQVLHDVALQATLRAITDRAAFITAVVQLGTANGCTFTAQDVDAAMQANQRAWLERWIA